MEEDDVMGETAPVALREKASKLRTYLSLNLDSDGNAKGSLSQALSPLSYQFLLRRSSAVIEEQIEVDSLDSS